MDRRHFFQLLLSARLLTPLLIASHSRKTDREIYLISDTPHSHLPHLLKELLRNQTEITHSFIFCDPSPHTNILKHSLSRLGWKLTSNPSDANLKISFSYLHKPTLPSFTLVKDGRIWDVRSWNLRSLWQELAQKHAPSSLLTIVSLKRENSGKSAGAMITVYMNGQKRDTFSLKENLRRAYAIPGGRIKLQIVDGSARVLESSCQHKVCLNSPPVSRAGERIICAPNHFFVEVQGSSVDTVIG
jgi:hypothetical protein